MEIRVRHLDAVKFKAEARGHEIVCDQPVENGGSDAGMTPPELLLASLGTCAAYYAAEYLKVRSLPLEGLEVSVTAEKAKQPARLGSFQIHVTTAALDPRHKPLLERTVKNCLIHNTLLYGPSIDILIDERAGDRPVAHESMAA